MGKSQTTQVQQNGGVIDVGNTDDGVVSGFGTGGARSRVMVEADNIRHGLM